MNQKIGLPFGNEIVRSGTGKTVHCLQLFCVQFLPTAGPAATGMFSIYSIVCSGISTVKCLGDVWPTSLVSRPPTLLRLQPARPSALQKLTQICPDRYRRRPPEAYLEVIPWVTWLCAIQSWVGQSSYPHDLPRQIGLICSPPLKQELIFCADIFIASWFCTLLIS